MSIVEKLKLLFKFETAAKAVEEGIKMKSSTKLVAAVIALLTALAQEPTIQHALLAFIGTHPAVSMVLTGASAVLALLHVPVKDASKAALLLLALLLLPVGLRAQAPVPAGTLPANIYAFGPSYNPSASPAVDGSAMYARKMAENGTYGITVLDALPEPTKPFTVSTNVGVGVAQKMVSFRSTPIFGVASTGINWTGADTSWQWSGGLAAAIPLKKACDTCFLMPNTRFLSVGGGRYRPILGLWFGFGQ